MDLLKLYGPMAIFVFTVFVLFDRARSTVGLSTAQKKIQNVAFVVVWLTIFVMAGMIVVAWWRINFPPEFIISGTITRLTTNESITTEQEVYLRHHPVAGTEVAYDWRFISPTLFPGPIVLLLQKKNEPEFLTYHFPIRNDFYRGTVEIEYNRHNDHMTLTHESVKEEISPEIDRAGHERPEITDPILGIFNPAVVYASAERQAKLENLIEALDVDDPLVRQQARRDLIARGPDAVPVIEKAFENINMSYRLRLGLFSTLRDISPQSKQLLHESTRCNISGTTDDLDPTLREGARALVASGVSIPPSCPIAPDDAAPRGCTLEKAANEEIALFEDAKRMIGVYLVGVSTMGRIQLGKFKPVYSADIVVPASSDLVMSVLAKSNLSFGLMKRGFVKSDYGIKLKKDSVLSSLTQLSSAAYVKSKVKDGDSLPVTVNGKHYTVHIKTHTGFADITVCPAA
jgi:hypothetical protein